VNNRSDKGLKEAKRGGKKNWKRIDERKKECY
jgi:hypothetical protein